MTAQTNEKKTALQAISPRFPSPEALNMHAGGRRAGREWGGTEGGTSSARKLVEAGMETGAGAWTQRSLAFVHALRLTGARAFVFF